MRPKSPERRCRQKLKPRNENPETSLQYFLISVNVHEAKKLKWSNKQSLSSYVVIILGKEKHTTIVRKNMEEPVYGEYFIFEWYASIKEVQNSSVWLGVMEPKCLAPPRLLGEAIIDLGAVWSQPNHQVIHKWAQLSLPRLVAREAVGFLKVDIAIVCREERLIMPAIVNQDRLLEGNCSSSEQQTANYLVTVYGAFGLPSDAFSESERRYSKPPNTYVKVSFCGLMAKTAVQYRTANPAYCEQISLIEVFPNICQIIGLEVCSAELSLNKVLATTSLRLGQISHDGDNGFIPTFGPSLLHMYGARNNTNTFSNQEDGPFYKGALLVSLRTIVPFYEHRMRSTNVKPVHPINIYNLWTFENFCVYCPIFEVSMIDRQITGSSAGVAITIGDVNYGGRCDQDFLSMMEQIKSRKLHYTGSRDIIKTGSNYGYLDFSSSFPVLQLGCTLPDFRQQIYRDNIISTIIDNLETSIAKASNKIKSIDPTCKDIFEELCNALDDISIKVVKFLESIRETESFESNDDIKTGLSAFDMKQIILQKEEMEKVLNQLQSKKLTDYSSINFIQLKRASTENYLISKKDIKVMLAEMKCLLPKIKSLSFKSVHGWPDLVIWLLNGTSRVAFYKISAEDIIYSDMPEQRGKHCGHIQTIYLKPIKCAKHSNTVSTSCFCIAGKIEMLLWMAEFSEISMFKHWLPKGYNLKARDAEMCLKSNYAVLEFCVYIYQAKLHVVAESDVPPSTFVRMNTLNSAKETRIQRNTANPIWNEVLKIKTIAFMSIERLGTSPPCVLVEVYAQLPLGKIDFVGRINIVPEFDDKKNNDFAPKLRWYTVYKGNENVGQILMAAQIFLVPETLLKSTIYCSNNDSVQEMVIKEEKDNDYEELPPSIIPRTTTYKVDVYWWGLRDIETTRKPCAVLELNDLFIKSDIITTNKSNCNFPNGRTSQIFEASLMDDQSPHLTIKLFDSSTFGRTLFFGTNVVKNCNKYLVDWIPKYVREVSLQSASVASSSFCRVNDRLFVKKSSTSSIKTEESMKKSVKKHNTIYSKFDVWSLLCCNRKFDDEKHALLPISKNEKDELKTQEKSTEIELQNWWWRFCASQKESYDDLTKVGRIKIYYSELEYQAEFSKFKDWCKTLKLYNGNKTGIPQRDEQLQCGHLKAGIAIYQWPPPPDTVAVSYSGVDLERGYFEDYPLNNPSKYLVRIYIVRGMNLAPKDFVCKCDPYVVLKCGSKQCGDRSQYVPNNVNPVFGKMYEFRCTLPDDYLLSVSVYDHDTISQDDLIGTTTIDLENRIYSKHRARVGLSSEYNVTGPYKWRDSIKPSAILDKICCKNHIPPPVFPDNYSVIVNGVHYVDNDVTNKNYISASERKENICLTILNKWHTLPVCGYQLVPEHVETRKLYNPDKSGVEQGKIQMWLDIFPLDAGVYIPLPVDITPRKVDEYELRVVVWAVQDIKTNKPVNNNGFDIYVKAWIGNVEDAQYTDIHYHSVTGEGLFNWRMIFNLSYQSAEKKLITKEKDAFTEFEERLPPVLFLQVIDSDAVDLNDCLATLTLDLNMLPRGTKLAKQCPFDVENIEKKMNLFSSRSIRGWWPMKKVNRTNGVSTYAGLIDLELSLLPKEKAILLPVGVGREPPFPLPEPNRPELLEVVSKLSFLEATFGRGGEYLIIAALLIAMFYVAYYLELPSAIFEFLFG